MKLFSITHDQNTYRTNFPDITKVLDIYIYICPVKVYKEIV